MPLDLPIGSYLLPEAFGYSQDRIEQVDGFNAKGKPRWAVRSNGLCLSRALQWDHEPVPSSSLRTAEWMATHRYDSAEEAYSYWKRWSRRVEDDGH